MPEYLAPGVYVEEIDSGVKPIEGVSTSTAGFVGVTQRGPVAGLPVLVTSFTDFRRRFGSYLDETWGDSRFLAYAVQGFFENGGQRVYIKRVPGDGALASSVNLIDGIITRLRRDVALGATTATLESLRGISVGSNVTFSEVVSGTTFTQIVTVTAYDPVASTITWVGGLPRDFTQAGAAVIIRASAGDTLTVSASSVGEWGRDLSVLVEYTSPGRSQLTRNVTIPLLPLTTALAFQGGTGPDPVANPTSITLAPGHGAVIGDVVEFEVGGATEQRELTNVVGDVISWTDAVVNDYSVAGSTVRYVTAVRVGGTQVNIAPALASVLQPGDQVTLTGGGNTETLTIAGGWGGATPVDFAAGTVNAYLEGSTLALVTAVRAGDNTVRVRSSRNFYVGALVELDNGTDREYLLINAISGNDLTLSAATANAYSLDNYITICEFKLSVRYQNAAEQFVQTEAFDGLSMNPAVSEKYVVNVIANNSSFISVAEIPGPVSPFASPATPDGTWLQLGGGTDGTVPLDEAFIGVDNGPGQRTGIQALIDIDQISIVAVPGKSQQPIINALITHCETLKDRFAVIDPPANRNVQQVQDYRNLYDTLYAAIYYPWLLNRDPLLRADRAFPPSGHIIGIYARTDTERGVHKAPANEVIRGITGLELTINKGEQDILNPSPVNINVNRDFRLSGRGLRVWGARCMTSDTEWKYVNVRRLFIFLEELLDEGTQWAVFEPNDERLWARIRQSISDFLTRVWRDGALMGTQADEAFFVRCDRTTMTEDDILNGRLIVLVGVAPVRPAEYVIIRISQYTADATNAS